MENKINIAELLKDCPKGMELDCALFEGAYLEEIIDDDDLDCPVLIKTKEGETWNLTSTGCWDDSPSAKCIIFPKGKTTWEGFVPPCKFEDGDIVVNASNKNSNAFIYAGEGDEYYYSYVGLTAGANSELFTDKSFAWVSKKSGIRFATEEEKQKLFQAIKDNGYKWNAETKTLEKLIEPKFKVGDKITDGNKFIYRITEITDKGYKLHDLRTTFVTFEEADLYFVKVVGVFDITTLKPFDKILVRDGNNAMWIAALFSHLREMRFYTVSTWYNQCIPFEGNQHLLGTTNDCDEFYKTWTSEED